MNASPAVRALIAEDEPILAAVLAQSLLRLWPGLEIAATAPNGLVAVEQALALRPDLLFLDIRMPGQTGLEAAEELAERWDHTQPFPEVVFVTAYDDYALQAFEQAAADYVLKPVADERLRRTVERLQARLRVRPQPRPAMLAPAGAQPGGQPSVQPGVQPGLPANADADAGLARLVEQMRALLPPAHAQQQQQQQQQQQLATIRAAVGNVVRMIPVREVIYFQALDKYVNVATADGDALIRLPLRELLAQLDPSRFAQVSRGCIVNLHCVASASRDELGKLSLALRGRPERIKVSPLCAHLFKQM